MGGPGHRGRQRHPGDEESKATLHFWEMGQTPSRYSSLCLATHRPQAAPEQGQTGTNLWHTGARLANLRGAPAYKVRLPCPVRLGLLKQQPGSRQVRGFLMSSDSAEFPDVRHGHEMRTWCWRGQADAGVKAFNFSAHPSLKTGLSPSPSGLATAARKRTMGASNALATALIGSGMLKLRRINIYWLTFYILQYDVHFTLASSF